MKVWLKRKGLEVVKVSKVADPVIKVFIVSSQGANYH